MKLATIGSVNIGKSIGFWTSKVGMKSFFLAKNEENPI
jgi:hypothetical protein